MRTEERTSGDALIITVMDQRIDTRNADDLAEKVRGHARRGQKWIVLDISGVEFVDSSGLGAIVASLKSLGDGDLLISGAREPVRALFRLTRMDKVFRMFEDADEAARSASSSESPS